MIAVNAVERTDQLVLHGAPPYGYGAERERRVATASSANPRDHAAHRRRSGAVTRRIRLLRHHGLVHKCPKSRRYVVSPKGHQIVSALLVAYRVDTESLDELAA